VSQNEQLLQEMIDRSGQMGVPVLDIDGQIVVGFNRNKIMELLNIKE
jgi:glutaredoxin